MKNTVKILAIALLGAGLVACESMKLGDAGLSKAPETSGATIDTLFATIKDADKVLLQAYYYLPYGLVTSVDSKMGSDFLESITDHFISGKHTEGDGPNDLYYTGGLSVRMFLKTVTTLRAEKGKPGTLKSTAAAGYLGDSEGLAGHARAARIRGEK